MRARYVITVIAVLVFGLGAKQYFSPPLKALADINAIPGASMNILQMHIDHPNKKDLPAQKMQDMSVVFPDGD
jgi:hypothetical protein